MLVESFNPFGNLLLSSLIAAIPIILFLLCLTVFKMKGIYAAITTLVVTLLIAIPFFKLPVGIASGAVVEGFFQGIFPIGYIVIMAVLLYKITLKSGQFATIQDSITSISQDQRIQLLLIGFSFNAFLEGAAGFGVPIAICALLLAQLGFRPLQAAMLCLVANAASGAFGAIGIPVGVVDTLNLPGHVVLDFKGPLKTSKGFWRSFDRNDLTYRDKFFLNTIAYAHKQRIPFTRVPFNDHDSIRYYDSVLLSTKFKAPRWLVTPIKNYSVDRKSVV